MSMGVVAKARPSMMIDFGVTPFPGVDILRPNSLLVNPPPPLLISAPPMVVGTAMMGIF